jgi:hypothetical protein
MEEISSGRATRRASHGRRFEQFHNLLLPYLCFLLEQRAQHRITKVTETYKVIENSS